MFLQIQQHNKEQGEGIPYLPAKTNKYENAWELYIRGRIPNSNLFRIIRLNYKRAEAVKMYSRPSNSLGLGYAQKIESLDTPTDTLLTKHSN